MIELIKDYVILVGELDYTLARKTGSVDKKTGRPIYAPVGHYGTVSGAINRLREELIRGRLKTGLKSLSDAISQIKEANAEVDRLLEVLNSMEDDRK